MGRLILKELVENFSSHEKFLFSVILGSQKKFEMSTLKVRKKGLSNHTIETVFEIVHVDKR